MAGDLSLSGHQIRWVGTSTNRVISVGEEIDFPGSTAAYLRAEDSPDWHFDADFTIEVWGVKFKNKDSAQVFIAQYDASGSGGRSWYFALQGTLSPKQIDFTGSVDGGTAINIRGDFDPVLNQAYDICVDRAGDTVRVYVDGSMVASGTISGALHDTSAPLLISGMSSGTSIELPFSGRIKAARITKGVARYATDTNYTVPALPLPTE